LETGKIRAKLKDLISAYLNSVFNRDEMYRRLINILSPAEVADIDDELLIDSYFAIYYMFEEFCEVSDAEFVYLKNCLEGKLLFSTDERNKISSK
jgi:hypothetical protein